MLISFYLVLCRIVVVFLMALSPTNTIAHHTFFSQIEVAIHLEPGLNDVKCPYSSKDVEVANEVETVNIFFQYMIMSDLTQVIIHVNFNLNS